jgi:hypothetical protein
MKRFPGLARRAIVAWAIGISVSLLLFVAVAYGDSASASVSGALFWFVMPGLLAALGSPPRAGSIVMVCINAVPYSLIAFGFLSWFSRQKK